MAHYWISKHKDYNSTVSAKLTENGCFADIIPLNKNNYSNALIKTEWLGRCQILPKGKVTYYIDSAHTTDSMNNCCDWFEQQSKRPLINLYNNYNIVTHRHSIANGEEKITSSQSKVYKILIFNCTKNRSPHILLMRLSKMDFDFAIFTTNRVHKVKALNSDSSNLTVTSETEKTICSNNARAWNQLNSSVKNVKVSSIVDAIDIVNNLSKTTPKPVQVLITGSVHLVGGFIGQLHPDYIS